MTPPGPVPAPRVKLRCPQPQKAMVEATVCRGTSLPWDPPCPCSPAPNRPLWGQLSKNMPHLIDEETGVQKGKGTFLGPPANPRQGRENHIVTDGPPPRAGVYELRTQPNSQPPSFCRLDKAPCSGRGSFSVTSSNKKAVSV